MKKLMLGFVLFSFLLLSHSSCHSDSTEAIESPKFHSVLYHIQLDPEVLPIDYTKAMPVNPIPEPTAKSEPSETGLYNTLEYILYKYGDPKPIRKIQQHIDDEDFGSFVYDSLEAGSYTACFIAHSSPDVSFNDNTFLFNTMGDIFFIRQPFEVDGKEDKTVDIVLKRIVSRVEFVAIDDVPERVTHFTMNILPIYNQIHLLDGIVNELSAPTLFAYSFTEEEKQKGVKNKHLFYTFVPAETTIRQIELTSYSATEDTVRYRKVENIPIGINKLIRYTGTLYTPGTSDLTFDLSIQDGGAWEDTTNIVLPKSTIKKPLILDKHVE